MKKLSADSKLNPADLNDDGEITNGELDRHERQITIENNDKLQDQQRLICWVSVGASAISIVLVVFPFISPDRVPLVTSLLSTYVVSNMGIVGCFMGATAFSRAKEAQRPR